MNEHITDTTHFPHYTGYWETQLTLGTEKLWIDDNIMNILYIIIDQFILDSNTLV